MLVYANSVPYTHKHTRPLRNSHPPERQPRDKLFGTKVMTVPVNNKRLQISGVFIIVILLVIITIRNVEISCRIVSEPLTIMSRLCLWFLRDRDSVFRNSFENENNELTMKEF